MTDRRLPDFLIIGAAKSGTTALYRWLDRHPDIWLPEEKEPHFFGRDKIWANGLDWYAAMFAGAPVGAVTGEASTTLTSHRLAHRAAERVASVVPSARLVYLLREPVSRMRSHYALYVRTGAERRKFADMLADPTARYVVDSLYYECLEPYLERFPLEQILVVRYEDLYDEGHPAWPAILDHLGLATMAAPGTAHNVAAGHPASTPLMHWLRKRGFRSAPRWTPRWLRRAARPRLLHEPDEDDRLVSVHEPVPAAVIDRIAADSARLAEALDRPPLWPA